MLNADWPWLQSAISNQQSAVSNPQSTIHHPQSAITKISNQPSTISIQMLPPTLPLFPLPNVVLFPNVCLPLHVFEPRYRQMVADALDGDRIIGMTLLRPGYEAEYERRPAIYPIGCAGVVTHSQPLADGRYDI